MKLLAIGHFCYDVAHPTGTSEVERPAGIARCVEFLASIMESGDTVLPVFGVARNEYQAVTDYLTGRVPGLDTSGIFKIDGPTNRVHLYPRPGGTTVACSKDIAPPIPYAKIRRHLSADGILINMMSGFDIALETLDHIRMAVREHNIPIHFDYHNLTLGINENHERYRRPLPEWRRWAFMTESVQLNEEELAGLPPDRMTEEQAVGHLLTLSVKGVLLTRGAAGATLFRSEHKHLVRHDIAATPGENHTNAIGAGDMLGAAFLYHYVKTKDMVAAAEFSCHHAAAAVRDHGPAM